MTDSPPTGIALDIHTHLIPVDPAGLEPIDGVREIEGKLEIDGHLVGVPGLYRPDQLLDWMAQNGVERAVISAPPPAYRTHLAAADALAWARYLNRGLQAIAADSGGRLVAAAQLPLGQPDMAAKIVDEEAAAGTSIFAAPAAPFGDRAFSDAALEPVWARLDQAGAILFLHPGSCCDGRLKAFYLENLLGNPYETSVAAAHLVFGGVLERYPSIRFGLAHGGGVTPMVAGRWRRGADTARPGVDTTATPPDVQVRRFFVDSIVHSAAALDLVADVFGEENILFGSDWPFPMGLLDPAAQLAEVPAPLLNRIFRENAKKFS